ncbi:putrescine export ABC transporter permease SapB [Arsenophonus symbiont of Ornithomya chloropus]|uniref:putrescine export ABC transporter permease SapB n=1 Tax=Arsenophonus symbiont of Ornithomya chloropus TaxID=634121 RepID=UPI0032B1EFAB
MIIYLLKRSLLLIITFFLLTLISFSLNYFTKDASLNTLSLINDYISYFENLLHWNFGISAANGQPISDQIHSAFPATIELCLISFLLALIIGIPTGIIAGTRKNKPIEYIIKIFTLIGLSIPIFALSLLLILLFSLKLNWLPNSGRIDLLYDLKTITGFLLIDVWLSDSTHRYEMFLDIIKHLILPVITLAIAPISEIIRFTKNSIESVMNKNYITAAKIRGLSKFTIIRRHVLHNALPPIIPKFGLQFSRMITLAIITEFIFNWPGLGYWLITSIRKNDYSAISSSIMIIGNLVIFINFVSDILKTKTNPYKYKNQYVFR